MSTTVRTASALVIGNELLTGKIREANLFELARTLRSLGVELRRAVVVTDDVDVIASEVRHLSELSDIVFTSGGVGPTHDDVTLEGVAAAFGLKTHLHPEIEIMLRTLYGERVTEGHLRMALVPEGARVLSDDLSWPTVVVHNVWVLPGVPEAFRTKLTVLREHIRGPGTFHTHEVFTKMDEGDLKPLLDHVVNAHPDVELGSYPKWFDPRYKTKVTFDARARDKLEAAVAEFLSILPSGEPQDLG